MDFFATITQMLGLFMMIIVGYVCYKIKLIDLEFNRSLSIFVVNVTCPFMIAGSVMGREMPPQEVLLPLLSAGIVMLVLMVIASWPLTRLLRVQGAVETGIYRFMFIFGNYTLLGLPIINVLFGSQAVFYSAALTIPLNLLMFTYGMIIIVRGKEGVRLNWRMAFSPCMTASYLAIALVYFQVPIPYPVAKLCSTIGSFTPPTALIVIGASLAAIEIRRIFGNWKLYAMCGLKLVVVPVVIYGLLLLTPLDPLYVRILFIQAAMPVANLGTIFCLTYRVDDRIMTQGTFLSTLLAVFTIPLLTLLV